MEPFTALIVLAILIAASYGLVGSKARRDTIERGRELLMAGMTEDALGVFERLARQRDRNAPGRERAFYWLARTHEELGHKEAARDGYRRYLAEYVFSPVGPRAEAETEQLVRERLARMGATVVPPAPAPGDPEGWARYRAEHERLWSRFRPDEKPASDRLPLVRPTTVEVPGVSPERLAADQRALAAGRRLGDYVLTEKIGEGGFGDVFRAVRPVAIKLARDPGVVEHLRRFGTIQGQVKSDRVVRPLEVNLTSDPPYVVMELVDGCTLRDLLSSRKLTPDEALAILREVALGLRDAHEQGVLHLDLKPENVLLDESGGVKLTDFELGQNTAEAAQFRLSRTLGSTKDARVAGTIAYMSPEQRDGKVPDARSDVYTFGVLLFEALTGELPQPGDKPSDLRKDLPHAAEIDQIFLRCFTRSERRHASARELVRDLEPLVGRLAKVDLAALLRATPEARARVAERARLGVRDLETASGSGRIARTELVAEPPAEPEPPAEDRERLDALIQQRAAAAREAVRERAPEAGPPVVRSTGAREDAPASTDPRPGEPVVAPRPPIPVVVSPPPAERREPEAERPARAPELEAG